MTQRGNPCKYRAVEDTLYCAIHGKSERYSSDVKMSTAGRPSTDNRESTDTIYRGRKGQFRCIAVSSRGQLCPYQSVNDTVYCFCHAELSQVFFQSSSPPSLPSPTVAAAKNAEETESDSDDSSEDDDSNEGTEGRPYRFKEFMRMWHECEEYFGEMTDEIESTRRVRGANSRMSPEDTNGQLKAQYGRLLPRAMKVSKNNVAVFAFLNRII